MSCGEPKRRNACHLSIPHALPFCLLKNMKGAVKPILHSLLSPSSQHPTAPRFPPQIVSFPGPIGTAGRAALGSVDPPSPSPLPFAAGVPPSCPPRPPAEKVCE